MNSYYKKVLKRKMDWDEAEAAHIKMRQAEKGVHVVEDLEKRRALEEQAKTREELNDELKELRRLQTEQAYERARWKKILKAVEDCDIRWLRENEPKFYVDRIISFGDPTTDPTYRFKDFDPLVGEPTSDC